MRDAQLLGYYLSEVVDAGTAIVLAHDRGDSVAMILAGGHAGELPPLRLEHLFLTNGNIFLPLSSLTMAQRLMLDEATAPGLLEGLAPSTLAEGLGAATFFPPRDADDPGIEALTETFAYQDGVRVLHETIQYLVERSADEDTWLEALAESEVPTTLIWGLNDAVSPPRVASWVWHRHLMFKPGRNSLYYLPDAGHYLQNDRPDALVDAVLHALDATDDQGPGAIEVAPAAPILVDRSRERLPSAAEVLPASG
jgi:pimeloyl-ACP methyl ester carboxylesterase